MHAVDYDRVFGPYKCLHSVYCQTRSLRRMHPDYRIIAEKPFYLYTDQRFSLLKKISPSICLHWLIADESLLEDELEMIARRARRNEWPEESLLHFNRRSEYILGWFVDITAVLEEHVAGEMREAHKLH